MLLKKKKFIKMSSGRETRSFNYIDDFSTGLKILINKT